MRLDKLLANSQLGSRKEVKKLIKNGAITIDDKTIKDPGYLLNDDEILNVKLNNQLLNLYKQVTIMLHKPVGVITARSDDEPTVFDLIPPAFNIKGLNPVGRLDKDTTGLLILTTDGDFNHLLTSPRANIPKIYEVHTEGKPFSDFDVTTFLNGIKLDDGLTRPATLEIVSDHHAFLTITEGRFHQVKRMMIATGRVVVRLHRTQIGSLKLDIKECEVRFLTNDEIDMFKQDK